MAGPLISLVLAGVAYRLTTVVSQDIAHQLIDQLFRANLVVGVFNLLPGLPLDGGRLFRRRLVKITGKPVDRDDRRRLGRAGAGRLGHPGSARPVGAGPAGADQLRCSGWPSSPRSSGSGRGQAIRAAKVRERLPELQARRLARRAIRSGHTPLAEAIRRADAAQARALVVVDHDSTPIAIVNETAVIATPRSAGRGSRPARWPGRSTRAWCCPPTCPGWTLIEAVRRAPASEYLLIEPSGQVYGVLATSDLDHAFAGV